MTDIKKETSDKLKVDKNHICRARNDIDSAIAWIQGLEIIDPPKSHIGSLRKARDLLDWYARFLTPNTTDPESVFVHNLAHPGVIDNDS